MGRKVQQIKMSLTQNLRTILINSSKKIIVIIVDSTDIHFLLIFDNEIVVNGTDTIINYKPKLSKRKNNMVTILNPLVFL